MEEARFTLLESRAVLAVNGPDRQEFLQGLISNDVTRVTERSAAYAAFLTPQGKYLHDFFVAATGDSILLDCERARLADLMRRLRMYKLRSSVDLTDHSGDLLVAAVFGPDAPRAFGLETQAGAAAPFADGVAMVDPRLAEAGVRAILPQATSASALEGMGLVAATAEDYDRHRLGLGLPDGSRDMVVDKATLLENGFEELNGVDFDKGCYLGQEVTARTKYRGLVKKRLMPVAIDGPIPAAGTPVLKGGREVGELRSASEGVGLALIRIDALGDGAPPDLAAGEARIVPSKPQWANY